MMLYVEGVSGSSNFRDVELKAEYVSDGTVLHTDKARLTVFEVTQAGLFSGEQQVDDEARHSTRKGISDQNGTISWHYPDPQCRLFNNCMEDQGTIKPAGVSNEATFSVVQEYQMRDWEYTDHWVLIESQESWAQDATPTDTTPSTSDHIYLVDGPGFVEVGYCEKRLFIANLRVRVDLNLSGQPAQCSGFFKWHSQVYMVKDTSLDPPFKRGTERPPLLGSGWIEIPQNP